MLQNVDCPPSIWKSFNTNTNRTVRYCSNVFSRTNLRAKSLLQLFLELSTVRVKQHTSFYGRLVDPARMKANKKVKQITVRELTLADDAAFVARCQRSANTIDSVFCLLTMIFISLLALIINKMLSQKTDQYCSVQSRSITSTMKP